MELSEADVISMLLTAEPARKRSPLAHRPTAEQADLAVKQAGRSVSHNGSKKRGCKCGDCASCTEAARWERIFREKFADPEYYSRPSYSSGSSLGWLTR